jgi:hypothetical protein
MLARNVALIAIVPTLTLAGPKPKKPKKPPTTAPADTAPKDAPAVSTTPDAKDDVAKDAAADPKAEPATAPAVPGGGITSSGSNGAVPADKPGANEPDVDALRQEYLALRDELFKSRARANAVASQLYSTRIQVKFTYTTARYYNPAKASIRLDGATVYENATGAIGSDDGIRFDGYVAPGRHQVTFRVEATGKDDDSFTSTTETQIAVKAVAGKDLVVTARAKDGGDIAYEWKTSERGNYGLGIDVSIKAVAHADSKQDKK